MDDYGPQTLEAWVEGCLQRRAAGIQTFGVVRGDLLGGMVEVQMWNPIHASAHCLFKRDFWGSNTTIPALVDVASALFAVGVDRLTLQPFSDNLAMISLLKRLGAVEEGRMTKATRRLGAPVDLMVFALTKEALECQRPHLCQFLQESSLELAAH